MWKLPNNFMKERIIAETSRTVVKYGTFNFMVVGRMRHELHETQKCHKDLAGEIVTLIFSHLSSKG